MPGTECAVLNNEEAMHHTRTFKLGIGLLLFALVSARVLAQTRAGNNLIYGSAVTNTISEDSPLIFYTFNGSQDDLILARVIAMSPEFDPTVSLLNPSQQPVIINNDDPFLSGSGDARIAFRLPEDGIYSLVIGGARRSTGDFVLLLDSRQADSRPTRLTVDDEVKVDFSRARESGAFRLLANADSTQVLSLQAEPPTYPFTAELRSASGEPLAILNRLPAGTLTVPPGEEEYLLIVSSPDENGAVTIILSAGQAVLTETSAGLGESTEAVCAVTPVETSVNVRSGPGTGFPGIGFLNVAERLVALGYNPDRNWIAVQIDGQPGWVAAGVTALQGPCADLAALAITATPTPILPTDTPSRTPIPTHTLTPSPTFTPSPSPTLTPTITPTFTLDPVLDAPYDEDYTRVLPFYTGDTFTEQISAPGGDSTDIIAVSVEGFNPLNTRTEYSFRLDCVGSGTEGVAWGFDVRNPDKACGESAVIVFTEESNDQRIIITLPEGSPQALVYYTLVVTKL